MRDQTITKTLVDSLKPRPEEYSVWDSKLPGFGVRVRPTGARSFIVVYRAGSGRQSPVRRYTIGAIGKLTPDGARTRAKQILGAVANGENPSEDKLQVREKKKASTFDEVADIYIEQYAKLKKTSWKNDEGYLKRPRAKWKSKAASDVTDDDVAELLDNIAATAPVSANRTQSVLHTLFGWAREPGRKYVNGNPVTDMKRRSREKRRDRVLEDAEIKALWWGLDNPDLPASRPVALALKFVLVTMVRPGQAAGALNTEMLGLNSDGPQFHIPRDRVKRRREVIVPLNDIAVGIVNEACEPLTELPSDAVKEASESFGGLAVFPSTRGIGRSLARNSLSAALAGKPATANEPARIGIREFLGMKHFTPHDLRRTAATLARRAGARREDVKAMLDHLEGDVTAVYDKYDMISEKREVATILAEELRKIVGGRPEPENISDTSSAADGPRDVSVPSELGSDNALLVP